MSGAERIPLIIDTDPGIDDAVALLMAAKMTPLFDLRLVTVVVGNVSMRQGVVNAAACLNAATLSSAGTAEDQGRPLIPIVPGCEEPLNGKVPPFTAAHLGHCGLGNHRPNEADLLKNNNQNEQETAGKKSHGRFAVSGSDSFAPTEIVRMIRSHSPKTMVLLCLGPLTNLSVALSLWPQLLDHLKACVIMGGHLGTGNTTPTAEFNFYSDQVAAANVIAHCNRDKNHVVLVPLNPCDDVKLSWEYFDRAVSKARDPNVKQLLSEIFQDMRFLDFFMVYDPWNVVVALELFSKQLQLPSESDILEKRMTFVDSSNAKMNRAGMTFWQESEHCFFYVHGDDRKQLYEDERIGQVDIVRTLRKDNFQMVFEEFLSLE